MDVQKVVEKLAEHDFHFKHIREKLSHIELRQSDASGETNDAIRAVHAYATGGSMCMPEKACKTVCELIMAGENATYWQAVLNKDLRRCEFELYKFFMAFCKNNVQAVVQTQHSTGEPAMMLPSTRARLAQCEKDIESKLPKLDKHLVELYKLTMPIDQGYTPTTVAELKASQVLPEHSMYRTLTEEQAGAVWQKLKEEYPKLAEIETIPLQSIVNIKYENWHTKILRQIRAFNVHTEKVIKANNTIIMDQTYKAETAKSEYPLKHKLEISKANYNAKSLDFWTKHDFDSEVVIKQANNIRKRWKNEAKSSEAEGESIKKAKGCSTDSDASIDKE
jgi:hypothetical protein